MVARSSGKEMILSQEDRFPDGHGMEDRRIQHSAVAHHTASAIEFRATVGTTVTQRNVRNRLLQGQMKVSSTAVPVMDVCWSEGGQGNA
ncbi:hypothetical protein TNCV_4463971 [Trichonephila clavipes]|nr:hypothetical protein TNCV_4463971 [Trichonephila clavipes]